jgi:O-antigen ligase
VGILGFIPYGEFYPLPIEMCKMLLTEWGIWIFVGLFFVKNNWLKAWFIWALICLILQYNKYSYAFANTILRYVLLYQILTDKLDDRRAGHILDWICVIICVHIGLMYIQWQGYYLLFKSARTSGHNIFGFLGNSNNAGMLIAMGLPAFLRRKWCWFLPIIAGGLILSQHETSLLAVLIGIGIYAVIKLPWHRIHLRWKIALFSVLAGIGAWAFFRNRAGISHSVIIRLRAWKRMLIVIRGSPIQGLGLGQYRNVFPAIDKLFFNKGGECWLNAHNSPLQLTFEQGVLGLGLMAGFVCSNIERYLKRQTELGTIALVGVIIAIVGCFGHFTAQTSSIIIPIIMFAILVNQAQ